MTIQGERMQGLVLFFLALLIATPLAAGCSRQEPEKSTTAADGEKAAAGMTVAAVIANRVALAGKRVTVRGRVVKFMPQIMMKNWLHIVDDNGADPAGKDLTVTTDASAAPGDRVLVTGTVAVNRDFGSGYFYAVIIEDATVDAVK